MPKERFYQELVEKNKKEDIIKAKNKVRKRLILLALIILLGVSLLIINLQNNRKYEQNEMHVESARSITDFEPITLEDGKKIIINRITIKGSEGIVYLTQEDQENKKENKTISVSEINESDNEIKINEKGLNLKIYLNNKIVEEVKE